MTRSTSLARASPAIYTDARTQSHLTASPTQTHIDLTLANPAISSLQAKLASPAWLASIQSGNVRAETGRPVGTPFIRRAIVMADVLPPGYRFYPTEEELICFYLRNKLDGRRVDDIERVIPVVDVYSVDPFQLSEIHESLCGGSEGEPWFFFCERQEREARGGRPSRTTPSGYWKAAGTPGVVYAADRRAIGMRKTMVFYRGRAPSGAKTKWKMNEYRAFHHGTDDGRAGGSATAAAPLNLPPQLRSEFSLCRLYTKSGTLRQFDRRPVAAAAGGDNPGPSMAAAVSPDDGDGSGGSMQPHEEELMEGGGGDPYGEDISALAALLYWQ